MNHTSLTLVALAALVASACDGAPPVPAGSPATGSPAAEVATDAAPAPKASGTLCTLGQRVLTPGGKAGTVTKVEGSGCTVTNDATGLSDVWAAFMLKPAPGTAPVAEVTPGAPAAGMYLCRGGPAGNFRIAFNAGSSYANEQGAAGAYAFDPATANIDFTTGPWAGFYGRVLADGDVGMTGKPDRSFFAMTCEREAN
jgi:hypothetical protein